MKGELELNENESNKIELFRAFAVQDEDTWRLGMRQTLTADGPNNKARKRRREAWKGFKSRNPLVFNVWGDINGL